MVKWNENELSNIINNLKSNKPTIISHEHLLLPGIYPKIGCSITNIHNVKELAKYLKSVIKNPKIIIMTQSKEEIIASRYLQYLLQGGPLNIKKFISLLIPDHDVSIYADYRYKKILNIFIKEFGNNNVITLDTVDIKNNALKSPDRISNFIGTTININNEFIHKRANVGLSNYGAKMIRIWNKLFVIEKEKLNCITKTRISYTVWLSFVFIIRKIDDLIWKKEKDQVH
jgi:hypothetical protein